MDKTNARKREILEEETRESLIALSYTEPSGDPASGHLTKNVKAINDGNEKYRSELISISYSPPPKSPTAGVDPGKRKG